MSEMEGIKRIDETEAAKRAIFGTLLVEIKNILKDIPHRESGLDLQLEDKTKKVSGLRTVVENIIGKDGMGKLNKLSQGNDFEPLEITEATDTEINEEKLKQATATEAPELTGEQAKDLANNKKVIAAIIPKLFSEEEILKLADIKNLAENHPKLAAYLGKMFKAVENIDLHLKNLEKARERELDSRQRMIELVSRLSPEFASQRNPEGKPIVIN